MDVQLGWIVAEKPTISEVIANKIGKSIALKIVTLGAKRLYITLDDGVAKVIKPISVAGEHYSIVPIALQSMLPSRLSQPSMAAKLSRRRNAYFTL